jgi:stage II sporulation protein D
MYRFTLLLITIAVCTGAYPQKLSISLFNELKLNTVLITPTKGSYKLITGNGDIRIAENQIIYLSRVGDSILVRDASSNLGTWSRVSVVGQTGEDVVRVKSIMPAFPARLYDDNLSFYVQFNRIMAINMVDQEKYIAAVVEAEAGPNKEEEFYKAQALIARTFALAHVHKHESEGFNLCDGVHCQAYKGRSERDEDIYEATSDTKDMVIVDSLNHLITTAFHANCGGQTANSEDVWVTAMPYLRSVDDKYCLGSRSSSWEVRIPLKEWKAFVIAQGVDSTKLVDPKVFEFFTKGRAVYYTVAGVKIPTTKIRNRFKLRSTYFSVDVVKNAVRIIGRGYGHGVGLCQDGAMDMARRGWDYEKIVKYFYRGIKIVYISEVQFSETQETVKDSIP